MFGSLITWPLALSAARMTSCEIGRSIGVRTAPSPRPSLTHATRRALALLGTRVVIDDEVPLPSDVIHQPG